jgi:1,4-alpha-glucan branching enzyme
VIDKHVAPDGTVHVRFTVPAAFGAVAVIGDFNDWDAGQHPFRPDGERSIATAVLATGRRYAFRYLTAGGGQCNDEAADDYEADALGAFCSVLDLTQSFAGVGGGT